MAELLSIILAAGEGTRMKSALPKVLHPVGGLPIVSHVVRAAQAAGSTAISVVIGPGRADVAAEVTKRSPTASTAVQTYRLGTGHAVREARQAYANHAGNVVVLLADAPMIGAETISAVVARLEAGAEIVVVGFDAADPTGYGRMLTEGDQLKAIREHRDATEAERGVRLCNSGIIGFKSATLNALIDRIENKNAKGEYYLTDAIEIANADGRRVEFTRVPEAETLGINDRSQLAKAEAVFQQARREDLMKAGVTMRDPATVFLSWDTEIAQDVTIEPNVVFGPGVKVGEGAVIHAFSHIEGATIGAGVSVGPFARLRPGADLAEGAKVGNFVEVKNAKVGKGAKLPHLSYIGDAEIGAKANLGAGTITCNYDGVNKAKTVVGEGAFIGSNSSLVAPVTIGPGAYVGSGSVITKDVEAQALAVARARQENKPGYAPKLRARAEAIKAAKAKG